MHEKCDSCGKEFEILAVIFTGRQCLCASCYEARLASRMGTGGVPDPSLARSAS